MSEKTQKGERRAMTTEEEIYSLRVQLGLFQCLLSILVFQANQTPGEPDCESWRVVFSPNLVKFGKSLQIKIASAAEEGQLLPDDVIGLCREYLKLSILPFQSSADIEGFRKMLDPEVIKRTYVVTVRPRLIPPEVEAELKATLAKAIAEKKEETQEALAKELAPVIQLSPSSEPEVPATENRGRGRFSYCELCRQFYQGEAASHTC